MSKLEDQIFFMRKNIFTLFAFAVLGSCVITGCSKKAVVTPKPTSSAITLKTGTTTGSTTTTQNTSSGTHSCGGGGQHDSGSSSYHPGG